MTRKPSYASPCPLLPPTLSRVYLNFRVFTTSVLLHAAPGDREFYIDAERRAVAQAALTVALCRRDAVDLCLLARGLDPAGGGPLSAGGRVGPPPPIVVLLPPLRADVAALVQTPAASLPKRWVSSICRLSPEKNVGAFVDLVAALAPDLRARGLRPLVAGAVGDAGETREKGRGRGKEEEEGGG